MSKPVQLHPTRSPARTALAKAVAERDHVAEVLRGFEEKYEAVETPYATWERRDEIERELGKASGVTGKNVETFRRMERTAALLRGEDPADIADPVDPSVALRAELAEIDERLAKAQETRRRISADVDDLRKALDSADSAVRSSAAAVMAAEGGRDALIAAQAEHAAKAAILARAIEGAASPRVGGGPAPSCDFVAPVRAALAAAPCPWAAAAELLKTDPDASIPTVEAALASVGGPRSSARNAA